MSRSFTAADEIVSALDNGLRTVLSTPRANRANPAGPLEQETDVLSENEKVLSGRLMRVNHAGEICAQALYQGQAWTARNPKNKTAMQQASEEENDHLAWCEQRLNELDGHKSYLTPVWYLGSFLIGSAAGLVGDKWSLGFLAETERQVVDHLDGHLDRLPADDQRSRAIIEQMKADEGEHATQAIENGAAELPAWVKAVMKRTSKIMTNTAAYI